VSVIARAPARPPAKSPTDERFFDARDGEPLGRFARGGDHGVVEGHALHRQFLGAERGREQPAVRVRRRVQQHHAHALGAGELADLGQHEIERAVDFAGREQCAIHLTQHFEGAPVALQVEGSDVELALQRREFGNGQPRDGFEAALAQAQQAAMQRLHGGQVTLGDHRGHRE
jgi:hypothetical protein